MNEHHDEDGNLTEYGARHIASEWHGGQASPLYAFASSGYMGPGIIYEIRSNIRSIRDSEAGLSYGESVREIERLENLIRFIGPQDTEDDR